MANIDASFGFRPINRDGSAGFNGKLTKYAVAASYATALYPGDPVLITGTGTTDAQGNVYQNVARAGTSGYTTGVIVDVIAATEASTPYIAASTGGYVLVADDPYQLFEVQADGSMAVTDLGNTADIIFTNAGSTVTNRSGAELDTADIGTGTQLVIEGFRNQDRNDLTSANPVAIVRFNLHQKRYTTGV